jgi:hypothetical protein
MQSKLKPNRHRARFYRRLAVKAKEVQGLMGELGERVEPYGRLTGLPDAPAAQGTDKAVVQAFARALGVLKELSGVFSEVRREPLHQPAPLRVFTSKTKHRDFASPRAAVRYFAKAAKSRAGLTYGEWVKKKRREGERKKGELSIGAFLADFIGDGLHISYYSPGSSGGGYVWSSFLDSVFPAIGKISADDLNKWAE